MGLLHHLFGGRRASAQRPSKDLDPSLTLTAPTRLFLIADPKAISSIHEILVKNGYDICEVNLTDESFLLGAERDLPPQRFRAVVEGSCKNDRWVVRISLFPEPERALQQRDVQRSLALRLQELTQALGWEGHWVVEGEAPRPVAA
jgi:hypothetical protein